MSKFLCTIAKKHGKTLTKQTGLISCSVLYGVATSTCIDL